MRQSCVSPLLLPEETRSAVLDKKIDTEEPPPMPMDEQFHAVRINDGAKVLEPQIQCEAPKGVRSLKEICARVVVSNYIHYDKESIPEDVKDIINGIKVTVPAIYSTKIMMLLEYLKKIPENDKVLVFSEWTSLFGPLSAILASENYKFVRLEGSQTLEQRKASMVKFETDKKVRVMLISLKVGSNGLTLVAANHCIFLEPWWNPCVHLQAQSRAHRHGQTKQVYSVYMIIQDTIEERVLEINEKKRAIAAQLLKGARSKRGGSVVALDKETVRQLLVGEMTQK